VVAFSESPEHVAHGPSAPAGYRVVLADEFGAGYDKSHWGDPFPLPWPPGPSANGAYIADPNDVNVRGGELQVTMTHHADGHWSAGGFNSFKAGIGITYGRVEFDAKAEAGQGTVAGILMWPADDTFPPEIDILETPKNTGLFTLHWGNGDSGQSSVQDSSFDPSQWHHYTLDWLPGGITVSVDGQVHARWTDHIPNVKMGFGALGVVGTVYEGWMGGRPTPRPRRWSRSTWTTS
jgi:beta-glucanase (GH16 family)